MELLYQVLGLLGAGIIVYLLYKTIKGRPEMFSRESVNRSFWTVGVLALGLIAFVALLVLMLRAQ